MKYEIKNWIDPSNQEVKAIFVDGIPFSWGIPSESISKAKFALMIDPTMEQIIFSDMCNHFLSAFSKFIGKDITLKEIMENLNESN